MVEDVVAKPFTDEATPGLLEAMTPRSDRRNKIKVLVAMFFGVLFGGVGNILLSRGMRCVGNSGYQCARDAIVGAVTAPFIIGGVLFCLAFLLLYMASLSWEDLSYVMPLTAGEYVLVPLLAYFTLQEAVDPLRWIGVVLVATGIVLVARS